MKPHAYRKVGWLLAAALFAAAPAQAQYAGAFARMGFGARGVALGNALAADGSGEASPYYNPALAPFTPEQRFEGGAALLGQDRSLQFLQAAAPLRPRAGIALGLVHAGVSGIDGRDNSGYHTSELSTSEFKFFLAFGSRIGRRLSAGVGLHLYRSDLYENLKPATSIGANVGLSARLSRRLRLGLAADDLLARYRWNTSSVYQGEGKNTTDAFPLRLRVGASYAALAEGRLLLLAEYVSEATTGDYEEQGAALIGDAPTLVRNRRDVRLHRGRVRLGAEWKPVEALALRAGAGAFGEGVRPSAGFRIAQPLGNLGAQVEYAFAPGPFGSAGLHFVTVRVLLQDQR